MTVQSADRLDEIQTQELANQCESPIEVILLLALIGLAGNVGVLSIFPQKQIEVGENTYRVDFLLQFDNPRHRPVRQLIVECDGHDYHERTKSQAKRDKERDRRLMSLGYDVMHFTGSEIFNYPIKCALEALFQLKDHGKPVENED